MNEHYVCESIVFRSVEGANAVVYAAMFFLRWKRLRNKIQY